MLKIKLCFSSDFLKSKNNVLKFTYHQPHHPSLKKKKKAFPLPLQFPLLTHFHAHNLYLPVKQNDCVFSERFTL